jgi:hypothetical protein
MKIQSPEIHNDQEMVENEKRKTLSVNESTRQKL